MTAAHPVLRLLPAPPLDPPYDDEVADLPPIDGTLALEFPTSVDVVPLRLVPPAAPPPGPALAAAADDDPRPWLRRLAQAVVEVLTGDRAAAQLSRYTSFDVLEQLERSTGRLLRGSSQARRPVLASVHICRPLDDVAEACAVVDTGRRHRAIALRLDRRDGHWQCTALQIC